MAPVSSKLAAGAAIALALGVATRTVARAFLFAGAHGPTPVAPPDFVTHVVAAADGVPVHVLELAVASGAPMVVHFHNNRETAEARADEARALHARGLGVALVEYRGYGASRGGEPSEEGLYLDAEAALELLASQGVGPEKVVLWGTSLGTGVAVEMARRGRGARLVLVSPYTSIPDLVTDVVPFLPARTLLPDTFDSLRKAPEVHVPTLVIHGDADEIVPFAMGERVAHAIGGARLLRVPSGRHGDLFARQGERLIAEIAGAYSSL